MAERSPRVTGWDVEGALRRAGWVEIRQRGSHVQMRHPNRPGRVTVSTHRREILKPATLHEILRQAGMTVEELNSYL